MSSPVRLRGEVGESWQGPFPGRRTNLDIARRVDEIVAAVREEEGREQAKLLTVIAELRAKIAGLEGRVEGFKIALEQYRAQEGYYERD